jgi:hypothetical protein
MTLVGHEAERLMAKMNWGRIGKERLLWEHKGGGGRVETEAQRLKRRRKQQRKRRGEQDAGSGKQPRTATTASGVSHKRRNVFLDGTSSWHEHHTRQAVQRLARTGLDAKGISRTLGISEAVTRRHLQA